MRRLIDCTVAVVGLGLMGGSLAGALRGRCAEVLGVDRDPETVAAAMQRGFIDWGTVDTTEAIAEADIVVLATPVRTIVKLLGEIGPWVRDGALLMDLGSTKARILAAMATLPDHVQPLGGHPMWQGSVGHRGARCCTFPGADVYPIPVGADLARGLGDGGVAGACGWRAASGRGC